MGLDSVEMIMRIEEEFGIELPDADVDQVRTVGDIYNLVLSKLETAPAFRPARSFFRLRRAIIACLGRQRKFISPSTKLAHLLPKATRIAAWKSLSEVSELEFPQLRHPRWARDGFRVAGLIAASTFFVKMVLWTQPSGFPWVPLTLAATIIGAFATQILHAATPFLAYDLPVRTVGELAQQLMGMNLKEFGSESEGGRLLSKEEIWERIARILQDQMELNREEIDPEARIVEDLNIR